jgi:AraC family transcriptional regulator
MQIDAYRNISVMSDRSKHHALIDSRIARAMLLLEQRMAEDVRMEEIAHALNLSLHHFHRLFVVETGEAPASYLRRIRLEAAALQLQRSSQPAGSIAHTRGYQSQAAFTRAFQTQFGLSPLQYRHEHAPVAQPSTQGDRAFKIVVAEVGSFRLLAMRFVGLIWNIEMGWDKLQSTLPRDIEAEASFYVGLLHNNPRLLESTQTRYDCCAALAPGIEPAPALLKSLGMFVVETRAGPYACVGNVGPAEDVPAAYDALCNQWLPQSGYHATDDPVLELFDSAPSHQEPQLRRATVLLPIE